MSADWYYKQDGLIWCVFSLNALVSFMYTRHLIIKLHIFQIWTYLENIAFCCMLGRQDKCEQLNRNVVILIKQLTFAAPEVFEMTTISVANDGDIIKMKTFSFQSWTFGQIALWKPFFNILKTRLQPTKKCYVSSLLLRPCLADS